MQNQEYLWYGYVYHFFKIKLYSYHNIRYQPHHSPLICQVEDISCLSWHVVAVIMHFLFVSKILSIGTYMYGLFSQDFRLYTRKTFSWDYQTLSHGKFVYSLANWWLIHLNLYNFICIFSHDLLTPHRSFGLGLEICFFFFFFFYKYVFVLITLYKFMRNRHLAKYLCFLMRLGWFIFFQF